jgi:nephrocystin-3
MQTERDVLVKRIFPSLRAVCMERGVGFTEVDLRWGVTRKQAERGEVLPICLAEIENCRPYFIGLLGQRYGWVPDSIPAELIREQPWLKEHLQCSITELEIVHGVLNNPEMAELAFFYFRDLAASTAKPESQEAKQKLEWLKERIRKSGFPVREDYPDAETAGQLIFQDLQQVIDREFPATELTALDRERLDHEAFAESRAAVYIGRQEYFDRLDSHVEGQGEPLVVLGESGSGKSALLANWALRYREANPEDFVILYFIGSTTASADYAALLRRIMGEIKRRYDLPNEIPDKEDELRAQFPNWLSMAAARGRFVLVLDALNQLEDRDNAPDLVWLPEFIPASTSGHKFCKKIRTVC